MAADGMPFTGFLYAGLMIDKAGAPKVIEFNVRFGDPETQPVMMRLQSDLLDLVEAAIDERLHDVEAQWDPRPSLGVVMAAEHYPGTPRAGRRRSTAGTCRTSPTRKVFHAGTAHRRRTRRHRRRPRAVRVRAGRHRRRGAAQGVRGSGRDLLARRIPPPRHRLARDRARAAERPSPATAGSARYRSVKLRGPVR